MSAVLVADDDKTCRDSIQLVLEREGYDVEATGDVDTALEAIDRRDFDLIVCDYRMPGKTGIDLLVELRKRGFQIPVLIVSAFTDGEAEMTARECGATDLLKKPFKRQELIERATRAVGG